jgi:hypothetical protein
MLKIEAKLDKKLLFYEYFCFLVKKKQQEWTKSGSKPEPFFKKYYFLASNCSILFWNYCSTSFEIYKIIGCIQGKEEVQRIFLKQKRNFKNIFTLFSIHFFTFFKTFYISFARKQTTPNSMPEITILNMFESHRALCIFEHFYKSAKTFYEEVLVCNSFSFF